MKTIVFLVFSIVAFSCTQPDQRISQLQTQVDSLKQRLSESYKPGFGEFMSSIQAHHAKLWFAGQNKNWELADFEIHEIMETIDYIGKYETDRKESKQIAMIKPALDSVNMAIQQKNIQYFSKSYKSLTNTCNLCHKVVNFGFNVVRIPEAQAFPNQDFKIPDSKN